MSYKTILVHVDAAPEARQRFCFAADLALGFDAHLIGCAPTGISRFIPPDVIVQARTPLADFCKALRENAADALRTFVQIVSERGPATAEERIIDDDACGIALHARYADLVVVSQPDVALPAHGSASDLPGYLLRESGRPILVLPGWRATPAARPMSCWPGTAAAKRCAPWSAPCPCCAARAA